MFNGVDFVYNGKRYVVEIDPRTGRAKSAKVAYSRVHRNRSIGVLRTIYASGQPAERLTLEIIREAEQTWAKSNRI